MLTLVPSHLLPLLVIAGAITTYLAVWKLVTWSAHTPHVAASFSAIITSIAILVAGYWYLVERRLAPHADLTQALTVVRGDGRHAVVESALGIKNLGYTELQIRQIDIRLQGVAPSGLPLDEVMNAGRDGWPASFPDGRTAMYRGTELQWPLLRYYRGAVEEDVEPGETTVVTSTFVVSCDYAMVRVAAEVEKTAKPSIAWGIRTFADLSPTCEPKEDRNGTPSRRGTV